ncbi:MAG: hypothetical protein H8D72_00875 [Planctomycetes bacterium]|nr:hypothetical protein [Planctomycetota bacterium]
MPLASGLDDPQPPKPEPLRTASSIWEFLSGKYDADQDGRITRAEYGGDELHWARLDADGSGELTRSEIEARRSPDLRKFKGKQKKGPVAPKVGTMAIDFELEVVRDVSLIGHAKPDAKGDIQEPKKPETVRLSSLRGKRRVALIFGSYT